MGPVALPDDNTRVIQALRDIGVGTGCFAVPLGVWIGIDPTRIDRTSILTEQAVE